MCRFHLGKLKQALQDFREAWTLDADYFAAVAEMVRTYDKLSDLPAAVGTLKEYCMNHEDDKADALFGQVLNKLSWSAETASFRLGPRVNGSTNLRSRLRLKEIKATLAYKYERLSKRACSNSKRRQFASKSAKYHRQVGQLERQILAEILPPRAMVAFAVRCAQRVQPLSRVLSADQRDGLSRALGVAEKLALGLYAGADDEGFKEARAAFKHTNAAYNDAADFYNDAKTAEAAAAVLAVRAVAAAVGAGVDAARCAPELAASDAEATAAAAAAATAIANAVVGKESASATSAAQIDMGNIKALRFDYLMIGFDPGESGPLGPYWHGNEPMWFRSASANGSS